MGNGLGSARGDSLRKVGWAMAAPHITGFDRKEKEKNPLSWRQSATTSMLLEICCFLVHKLGENIPEVTDPNFTTILKERWQLCRCVPVGKLKSVPRTDLF